MRMTVVVVAVALVIASQVPRDLAAQRAAAGTQPLVGTWQLSGLEQAAAGQTLARVPEPGRDSDSRRQRLRH
jgi:hypothetical protein